MRGRKQKLSKKLLSKTTLINQIQGELRADSGRIIFRGQDISRASAPHGARLGIARTYQVTSIFPEFSVITIVALARQVAAGHSFRFFRAAESDRSLTESALYCREIPCGARSSGKPSPCRAFRHRYRWREGFSPSASRSQIDMARSSTRTMARAGRYAQSRRPSLTASDIEGSRNCDRVGPFVDT
jgi:ABC-type sugar transport system ATPase subunit